MPFKFKWPFGWFSRPPAASQAEPPQPAPEPITSALSVAPPPSASAPLEPPARPPRAPEPERPFVYVPEPGEGPDLGTELLTRLPQLSTPPTLGQLGGLPAMAQTLPTVDRFMQQMPAAPVQRLLTGAWDQITQFTTDLPALTSLGGVPGDSAPPSFSETLAPSPAAAGLTDVLPPLGSLPGQVPAVSGEAPVLTPEPRAPGAPVVQVVSAPGPAAAPPEMPVLRAVQLPAEPGQPTPPTGPATATAGVPTPAGIPPLTPAAPLLVQPLLAPLPRAAEPPLGLATMLQLVSIESTLTGNVLPAAEFYPVLRELIPYAPIWRQAEPDAPAGPAAQPRPSEERVSPVQRAAIESQRGAGQPLEPTVRQQFEGAYGASLNAVRVHTGQAAHDTAQSLNAIAFASGPDLFFSHNTYQPASETGMGLLGHELAHVVQQQYGVAGDPDALRPADDHYERRADQMASAALATPAAAPSPAAAPVQRAIIGRISPTTAAAEDDQPSLWNPGAALDRADDASAADRPLATGPAPADDDDDEPQVQRFSLGSLNSLASRALSLPSNLPSELPSLDQAADRVSDLTDQLPNPGGMLSNARQMAGNMSGLSSMTQNVPSLPGGLPSLSNLPGSLGGLTEQLPALPSGLPSLNNLPSSLPGGLPSLGGVAQSLGGNLPSMPGLGDLPGGGALPSLGGLQPPEMPLAEGLGGAASATGNALQAGQEALGSITSLAPSMPELPSTPPLPSLEKITDHVWKQVQQRLKVERERSRGLA